jgi:predicted nucleic acid-binding Zn ribbon protein
MYKLYDYSCLNEECDKYQQIMEDLLKDDEEPKCEACESPCSKIIGCALGKVEQGTPKFHRNSRPK